MGELIMLGARHRRARPVRVTAGAASTAASRGASTASRGASTASCYVDVACPATYLAAERIDRLLVAVRWWPVCAQARPIGTSTSVESCEHLERRAAALGLPLIWPGSFRCGGHAARRVASYAAERGRAAGFVLAIGRLAYGGGFDLDDPEVLAEAAAIAELDVDDCLEVADDRARDATLERTARALGNEPGGMLPAIEIDGTVFWGEHRVGVAAAAQRLVTECCRLSGGSTRR